MNIQSLSIPLQVSPEHSARLRSLQETFASVCNALAPVVQETRCWNRVALHHMMYKTLREKFPQMGSQMVCNAIYSVSRTSRLVFQSAQSPFNIQLMTDKPLPLLQFLPSAPVYFDRHTLSLKAGALSMYTLDGRMRFELNMSAEDLNRFKTQKLHEITLQSQNSQYTLSFSFSEDAGQTDEQTASTGAYLPEYVVIDQAQVKTQGLDATPALKINIANLSAQTRQRAQVHVALQLQHGLGGNSSTHSLHSSHSSFTATVPHVSAVDKSNTLASSNTSTSSETSLLSKSSNSLSSSTTTISILPLGATP